MKYSVIAISMPYNVMRHDSLSTAIKKLLEDYNVLDKDHFATRCIVDTKNAISAVKMLSDNLLQSN